ncbi:hypothetical protein GCM10010912_53770 [Paenibacillus albidus]|uniref:Uncharacterized protein n=1 Tax=Paenibacillus albidus TaxID=2041023 RepID=A0A917CXV5_9BACL|nr:hypothetical protein [Paenibacillus albidus]GGG02191.1 hypothetical protein GCM10010912_53770 [Paenibacillus albidus]
MEFQLLYNEYLNLKFDRGLPAIKTDSFEYCLCEDDTAELFFIGPEHESFTEWAYELQPKDPNYTVSPDWKPVLSASFNHLDVYDELIFYYLLFTINTTTSVVHKNPFNAMNDFMKNYCFFQFAQLTDAATLNDAQKHQLRDFFFFFYLYAHPVNEETLYSFSFSSQDLVHTKTNITMEHYFSEYHDFYRANLERYSNEINLTPEEIDACKDLTLQLLGLLEGKQPKLSLPPEEGLDAILQLINNVDNLIDTYSDNKTKVFEMMRSFLLDNRAAPYRDHCFSTLLQNFVCYILYFNFDEINHLVDYFKGDPVLCRRVINKIFTETIFMQRIMWQNHIDIAEYTRVTEFFDEQARRFYL